MLILQHACRRVVFLFLLICAPFSVHSMCEKNEELDHPSKTEASLVHRTMRKSCKKQKKFSYYLYVDDFIKSFIEIRTSIPSGSTTLSSSYLAGRAPLYNGRDEKVGVCSASFLCMQNEDGIFTDISNYLSVDSGLIVTWFTPTTLLNLELDTILHSMVTECIVLASTKVGFNPFYGKTYNMVVSSDDKKIYFNLTQIPKKSP